MPSLTTHRTLVLAAVMAANFMIAIEATIVSTAMPQIVGQLGGLPLYSWVFSAFLLTQTATTVVFGKLADLIVVAANPLEHITNLRRLLLVLKEGRIVSDKRALERPT